jgi:hypothetical protein
MSLSTHSAFYFGYEVTEDNQSLDFDEGGGELTAEIEPGSYTLTTFLDAVESALNVAGALTYTVSVNRTTRIVTISAGSNFELLAATGTHVGSGVWSLLGFPATDVSGASSFSGTSASGSEYTTQFILQSYVSPDHYRQASSAVVNEAASGIVEVVKFGDKRFIEADFKFITSRALPSVSPIRNNATGLEDASDFFVFLITKAQLEFMPDEDTPGTFYTVILESYPGFSDGTGFKFRELYDRGLPGFYETGVVKFRVIE